MRTSVPAKAPVASMAVTAEIPGLRKTRRPGTAWPAHTWPANTSALRQPPIQTALEIQFRGVENLIRDLESLTWTRGRRRR